MGDIIAAYHRGHDIFDLPFSRAEAERAIDHLIALITTRRVKTPIAISVYELREQAFAELDQEPEQ